MVSSALPDIFLKLSVRYQYRAPGKARYLEHTQYCIILKTHADSMKESQFFGIIITFLTAMPNRLVSIE